MSTSAMTANTPVMVAAFPCAPLMPPSPDVTSTLLFRFSTPRYFLPAFMMVSVVPCTIPWGPM